MTTRKMYVEIAEAIYVSVRATENHPESREILEYLAERMAGTFKRDNPRFDYRRFMTACGFET